MENYSVSKNLIILILAIAISSVWPLSAQTKKQFEFRKDHKFKIAQFTDIHWDNNSSKCTQTIETIQHVLSAENPDLVILTGDVVTTLPAREGWLAVSKIFIDSKIPWAVTLGNHDAEFGITRDQIFEMLKNLPYFVGSKGPKLYGSGNYTLPIKASDSKSIAAVIYCFDSNNYPKDKKIGNYDWIKFDQIAWYRKTSDKFTALNNHSPIPSLAFFHIPIIEYNNIVGKESTIGEKNEEVASSEINSGLFASVIEKKDIMGVFVGHDHNNNYIGIEHNICLAYGQVSGSSAYGDFERGSRIIELHEGEFSFDSWIQTKSGKKYQYKYPSGLSSDHALFAQDRLKYFMIKVIDQKTSRGVPMVELSTSSHRLYYTDSNGIIAFNEPNLMNQPVSFTMFSHGYESPEDGLVLKTIPGASVFVKIKRLNIADRLYRITGQDIYGESVRIGLPNPIRHQGLNGKVMGQDTFIETLYKGKLYWFWGDTFGPASFNGAASGATSELPGKGGLDPGVGIDLTYFVDSNGFSKRMCAVPGPGLVWIDWLVTLPDEHGDERLYAKYSRTKTLDLDYERGIALFNDSTQVFEPLVRIDKWLDNTHSSGHPLRVRSGDVEYFYIFDRYGLERVRADRNYIINPESYEHFTCLAPGSIYNVAAAKLERDASNKIVYGWMTGTDAISPKQQNQLITSGHLSATEGWFRPVDIVSGNDVLLNPSSVFWNDFRKRWVMIASEFVGGVWLLEGDTPTGPWVYARKIVWHDKYDFYNIGQHPLFDQDGGRLIYFEGTYTTGFSGNTNHTPLYDYNQMMYRLALDDRKLSLPDPVYLVRNKHDREQYLMREGVDSLFLWESIRSIPFFALQTSGGSDEVVPVYSLESARGTILTTSPPVSRKVKPLFYAMPVVSIPRSQHDPISGTWKCKAIMPDSTDGEFELKLEKEGEDVTGTNVMAGHFRNDTLVLAFRIMDYSLTGRIHGGRLTGEFRKDDGRADGNWSGVRVRMPQDETVSSSVVFLYEYQKTGGKELFYSVDPGLSSASVRRAVQPVCRVWRNPSSVIALDYKAKPVLLGR